MRLEDDLMAGRKRWKDIIVFDFNGKDVFFKRIGYFNFEKYRNVIISLIQ